MEDHLPLPPRCGRDYEIQETLGHGQTGVVYRAVQRSLGRPVALKIPRPEIFSGKNTLTRFIEEARVTSSLDHPGIVIVLDYDLEGGVPWIVYELIEGPDLRTIIRESPPGIRQSIDLCAQVARALDDAHRRGIFHRDVKPENILRCAPETYKVADFGIAKWSGTQVKTETGILVGSLNYIAPERILGAEGAAPADIYALGVMLFELLAGRRPFEGDIPGILLGSHLRATPPRPSLLNARVSSSLDKVVLKALAKKPEERFADAAEMVRHLERVLEKDYPLDSSGSIPTRVDPKTDVIEARTAVIPETPPTPAGAPASRKVPWVFAGALMIGVLSMVAGGREERIAPPEAPLASPSLKVPPAPLPAGDFRQVIPGAHNLTLEMVRIPGGEYLMGSPPGEGHPYEEPQHRVKVPAFYLSRYEITRSQYLELMTTRESERMDGRLPMAPVIFAEARTWCQMLAQATGRPFRLPSEAEWEYACRGGTTTRYYFGDDPARLPDHAWCNLGTKVESDALKGRPGGLKLPNPYGLHDMIGNVYEWTLDDWHEDYRGAPADGRPWLDSRPGSSSGGVLRGGSWDSNADYCRVYTRFRSFSPTHPEVYLSPVIGFRVACSIE